MSVLKRLQGIFQEDAAATVDEGTSLFPYTQLINEQCSQEQKFAIVKAM